MNLFAKPHYKQLTASLLLGYSSFSHAVAIDDIPGANATINSLGGYIDRYIQDYNALNSDQGGLSANETELLDLCNDYNTAAQETSANDRDGVNSLIGLLEFVAHEEVGAVGSGFTDTGQDLVNNAVGRMQYLRTGVPLLANNSALLGETGGAAGDDFSKLSIYSNLSYGDGDKDPTSNEQGFDFDSQALTFGADYRFSDKLIAGMALGLGQSDVEIDNNAGDAEGETYSFTLYSSLYEGDWYLDASLGYAMHEYDSTRVIPASIALSLPSAQTLTSNTDGDSLSLSLGAGYNHQIGEWTADYVLRIDSVSATIDGYTENGGVLALQVGDQEVDSLQGVLGAQFSTAISSDAGVLVPSLGVEMRQEFDDESRVVTAQYKFDRFNNQFSFTSDDADENFFLLSAGASFVMTQGNQMFLNWDHLIGLDDVTSNTITAGFRMEL